MNRTYGIIYWLVFSAILAILPAFISEYYVILAGNILVYGLYALSWNLLFGYTGLLSLGGAAFFSAGAYTSAMILREVASSGGGMYLGIFAAVFVCLLLALTMGIITVRLSGWVFALVTLCLAQIIYAIVFKWRTVFGGDTGLSPVSRSSMNVFGLSVDLIPMVNYYYFILIVVMFSVLVLWVVINSPFGHALQAIRDNPARAQFIGLNIWRYRLASFIIAGIFAGLAGALFSPFKGLASPQMAEWTTSIDPMIMTLLGGAGTFVGPMVGAGLYIILEHFLTTYAHNWMLYLGCVIVVCAIWFPQGATPSLYKGVMTLCNTVRSGMGKTFPRR